MDSSVKNKGEIRKVKVMIVDDHAIVREGLSVLLKDLCEIGYIIHASDGREAIEKSRKVELDVIILDVSLPEGGLTGFETLEQLRILHQKAKIIMFSMYEDIHFQKEAADKGADGYLVKRANGNELMEQFSDILNGKKVFSALHFFEEKEVDMKEQFELPITAREKEIFILTVRGYSQKEIAEQLGIAIKTVENHRRNISKKLKCKKRSDWLDVAKEYQLI